MIIFEGAQFRIRLEKGEPGKFCSSGVLAILESEDDGNWHEVTSFDALWLGDLQSIVKKAKNYFDVHRTMSSKYSTVDIVDEKD